MIQSFFRMTVLLFALVVLPSALTFAAPPLLQQAETYTGSEAVTGWLMSEKLDGIRGYWTGEKLLTRKGKQIHAPRWFTADFPPFALDGELWRRRNDFVFVQRTVLDQVPTEDWRQITYNIFEVPEMAGDFPARLDKARTWFTAHKTSYVRIIEQKICNGPQHLADFLAGIEAAGGEGVMVKDPALPYQAGQIAHFLKVKNFSDMEGKVIAHNPGKGKLRGMMGSLTLQLENGLTFKLGTGFTNKERRHPPAIGEMVTFKYQGVTANGIPRFASFLRVRKD